MSVLVVVTGGSSGIGRAFLDAAPAGATRVDVSRSGHPDARHVAADLADPTAWPEVAADLADVLAEAAWERTVLLHAAGVLTPIGFAGEADAAAYTRNVLLNSASGQVLGHAWLAALAGRDPRPPRNQLCLVSSGAARTAYPGWSAYGAGKAALDHWVRVVGREQDERGGVEVCAIAPGVVDTAMQAEIRATDAGDFPNVARFHELRASGSLRDPDEVAAALWRVLDAGVTPGSVVDLRDLA